MTIYGRQITTEDLNTIASYMDDETRERLHSELAPCDPETFITAYLEAEPDFLAILKNEFGFEA